MVFPMAQQQAESLVQGLASVSWSLTALVFLNCGPAGDWHVDAERLGTARRVKEVAAKRCHHHHLQEEAARVVTGSAVRWTEMGPVPLQPSPAVSGLLTQMREQVRGRQQAESLHAGWEAPGASQHQRLVLRLAVTGHGQVSQTQALVGLLWRLYVPLQQLLLLVLAVGKGAERAG
jgi:hypothetical protein